MSETAVAEMGVEVIQIPITDIRENKVALRTVNNESEAYKGLCASIEARGFITAITVCKRADAETGETYYELVDGLHRFSAARDCNLTAVNAVVVEMNADDILVAQVLTNIHKIETKPAEYSKQLRRILNRDAMMTEAELAQKLGKSATWVQQRLNLNKIEDDQILALIDEGKIPLMNAYSLAKLPAGEHRDFLERAMTMDAKEFVPLCEARAKEIREDRKKGDNTRPAEFQPVAHLQSKKIVESFLADNSLGGQLISDNGIEDPIEAFQLALQWLLHLDPANVKLQLDKEKERKTKLQAERERKKRERENARATEAQEAVLIEE